MTKLLVSVRSAVEARQALENGADLIDVKEPRHGSLGAADCDVLREVVSEVGGRVPVSAALGELRDVDAARLRQLPSELQFAKLGPSGCRRQPDWREDWTAALDSLPHGIGPVAVIYADGRRCGAPRPEEIFDAGQSLGCVAALVDTYFKDGRGLLDCWSLEEVRWFLDAAVDRHMLSVLAGSLDAASIGRLLPLEPDYIAVRGAVCAGSRTGAIEGTRVARLAALVHSPRACSSQEV